MASKRKPARPSKSAAGAPRRRYPRDFIFIHINKTGGSSIERALGIPFEHRTALDVIGDISRAAWDRRFTFAVVRNPWDRVVSHYAYRVETGQTGLATNPIEFGMWVRLAYGKRLPLYYDKPMMFMPQVDWISDRDGTLLVTRVLRFERLRDEFAEVCTRLGRSAELPHVKASRRGDYRAYYDDETREIVAQHFRRDLEAFGYTFEGP